MKDNGNNIVEYLASISDDDIQTLTSNVDTDTTTDKYKLSEVDEVAVKGAISTILDYLVNLDFKDETVKYRKLAYKRLYRLMVALAKSEGGDNLEYILTNNEKTIITGKLLTNPLYIIKRIMEYDDEEIIYDEMTSWLILDYYYKGFGEYSEINENSKIEL